MSEFKAKLATIVDEAQDELMSSFNDMQTRNQDAATRSMWGGIIGAVGLPLLVGALTGGVGLVAASALAGIGSRVGREVGERTEGWSDIADEGVSALAFREGVTVDDIESRGILTNFESELESNLDMQWGDFDQEQYVSSAKDAASAFILGGGMKVMKTGFGSDQLTSLVDPSQGIGPPQQITNIDPNMIDRLKYIASQDYNFNPVNFIKGMNDARKADVPTSEPIVNTSSVTTVQSTPSILIDDADDYYDDIFEGLDLLDFEESMFDEGTM